MHRRVATVLVNPARGVGATPEESAGPEMELDIVRLQMRDERVSHGFTLRRSEGRGLEEDGHRHLRGW